MVINLGGYLQNRTRHTEVGCIEFTNKPNSDGYGIVCSTGPMARFYGEHLIHRIVWTHYNGPIPGGLCVMHSCDNRLCCNIKHLSTGTRADNNRDRDVKGRQADVRGEKNPFTSLTNSDVYNILSLNGLATGPEVAKAYNIDRSAITKIWRGVSWKHL